MTQIKETYLHKSGGGHNVEHRFTALGQKYEKPKGEAPRLDSTADSEERERLTFFYHPDQLNSTNFVTDIDGNATQFISYIPYGEVFVEGRNSSFSSSYLFNAKELDNETGLYYYGARYLDPQNASWLSVDPLWEKYPGVSPYSYCVGNPVRLVDPDGRAIRNGKQSEIIKGGIYSAAQSTLFVNKHDGTFVERGSSQKCYNPMLSEGRRNIYSEFFAPGALEGKSDPANQGDMPDLISAQISVNIIPGVGVAFDFTVGYDKEEGFFYSLSDRKGSGFDLSVGLSVGMSDYKGGSEKSRIESYTNDKFDYVSGGAFNFTKEPLKSATILFVL